MQPIISVPKVVTLPCTVYTSPFISNSYSCLQTPTDQQAQNLMWEISKIQETLLLMNEELKGLREVKERVLKLSEEKIKEQAHDSSTQT